MAKKSKGDAVQRRKLRSRLRRELAQAKRGAAKASAQGDAKSWVTFTSRCNTLEGRIAALKGK